MSKTVVHHMGEMIQIFLAGDCHAAFSSVKKESGRCGLDVLRLAVQHHFYFARAYDGLAVDRDNLTRRVDIRVSLALRDEISDLAWGAGMPRSHWVAAILARFFEQTEHDAVVRPEEARGVGSRDWK